MKIYHEIQLRAFQPWGGAKAVFYRFKLSELDRLEDMFSEDEYYNETDINDCFWFDTESMLAFLGIKEEDFWEREI